MKLEQIKEKISTIETVKNDDEMAHTYEDELFYKFVKAIKDRKYETKEEIEKLAKEVYKVRSIEFSRWHS